jgi:hypothetical protein
MAYEHKPNSGSLFKNEYKTADNQPSMKGSGKISLMLTEANVLQIQQLLQQGIAPAQIASQMNASVMTDVDIAAWTNVSKDNKKYFGLKIEKIEEMPVNNDPQAQYRSAPGQAAPAPDAPKDDDIPF